MLGCRPAMHFTAQEEVCAREKPKRDCVSCIAIFNVNVYYCDISCGGKEVCCDRMDKFVSFVVLVLWRLCICLLVLRERRHKHVA